MLLVSRRSYRKGFVLRGTSIFLFVKNHLGVNKHFFAYDALSSVTLQRFHRRKHLVV